MKAMADAGAPFEAILIAVQALDAKDAEIAERDREQAERRAKDAERKRLDRANGKPSRRRPRTIHGRSTECPMDPPIEEIIPPVSSVEETKPAPKSKPTSPAKPDGVSDPTWPDFQAHRRAKKAPITETALTAIGREAAQAGWTMEAALTEIVARDWRGFKAEWVAGPRGPPNGAANDGGSYLDHIVAQQRNRAAAEPTH